MPNLTVAQRRVLEAMADGCELHKNFRGGKVWLAHVDLKGGWTEPVRHRDFFSLWLGGLIQGPNTRPVATYHLTEAGRAALESGEE